MTVTVGSATIRPARSRLRLALQLAGGVLALGVLAQALAVVDASPRQLVEGVTGMADILSRALPPSFGELGTALLAAGQTLDIALVGTLVAVVLSLPLAVCAAENHTPSRWLYALARAVIALCRVIPDLVWALLFVAAVGLGPFAGALALSVHSIGMLGRLFAERLEDMDMGPVQALTVTGAGRVPVLSHAVVPEILPALVGIGLYRLDENVRSSLVLGFVGAGGIGFQLLSAIQLFDYRQVAMLLLVIFVLVIAVERAAAWLRRRAS